AERGEQLLDPDLEAGHDVAEVDLAGGVQSERRRARPKDPHPDATWAWIDQHGQPHAVGDVPLAAPSQRRRAFARRDDFDHDVRRLAALVRQLAGGVQRQPIPGEHRDVRYVRSASKGGAQLWKRHRQASWLREGVEPVGEYVLEPAVSRSGSHLLAYLPISVLECRLGFGECEKLLQG